MTRYCSDTTKAKIANVRLSKGTPGWLRAAVQNARHGYPMSEKQELRMIEALGIPSPQRQPRKFYRPCLSVELGEAIREDRIDLESLLWTVIVAGRQERRKRGE